MNASDSSSASNTDHPVSFNGGGMRGPFGLDISSLFKPIKGSYIPFSDGYRSCLGRRFSQAKILAVLAVIFRDYRVELVVDQFSSDEQIDLVPKGGPERQKVWQKAADRVIFGKLSCQVPLYRYAEIKFHCGSSKEGMSDLFLSKSPYTSKKNPLSTCFHHKPRGGQYPFS